MRDRRATIGIGGAAAVVVLVTLAIAAFGVRRLPAVPAFGAPPAVSLPGRIVIIEESREERRRPRCLRLVEGGATRELACPADRERWSVESVSWTDEGRIRVRGSGESGLFVALVDPDTGQVVQELDRVRELDGTGPTPVPPAIADPTSSPCRRGDGARLMLPNDSRDPGQRRPEGAPTVRIRYAGGRTEEVLRLEGPRDYRFVEAQWSPDGAWVLVRDSEQRLLVAAADGSTGPRLLAEDAGYAAWFIPGYRDDRLRPTCTGLQ